MSSLSRVTSFVVLVGVIIPTSLDASQWPTDPATNLPVGTDANANRSPKVVSDGQGGVIIAWEYSGPPTIARDIYIQRVNSFGATLWGSNGVPVTSVVEFQMGVSLIPDGSGGAIVAWQDYRNGVDADVYVQRLNADGQVLWGVNGVPLCTAANDQIDVQLAPHQQGGAVAVWRDMRTDGMTSDLFTQRVSPSGVALWALDGVPLCTNAAAQERVGLASTGSGATVVVWDDGRNQGGTSQDIFAQRVTSSGTTSWPSNGISLCTATRWQLSAQVVATGGGVAIVVWEDDRTASNGRDVYAQEVDSLGIGMWDVNGVPVCTTPETQVRPQLIQDGADAAIICWPDGRNGSSIYASRLNSSGQSLWTINGVAVCEASGVSDWPKIVADGSGGATIAWEDTRNNPTLPDVYAQRLDSGGSPLWIANGVGVSTAVDSQHRLAPVPDGYGGLIVAWEDWRDGGMLAQRYEVYAQHVNADGSLGGPTAVAPVPAARGLQVLQTTPNPFSSHVEIRFDSPASGEIEFRVYSVAGKLVFRDKIRTLSGENRYLLRGQDSDGTRLPSGVYFLRLLSGRESAAAKLVITR